MERRIDDENNFTLRQLFRGIASDWREFFEIEWKKEYFRALIFYLRSQYSKNKCCPAWDRIFYCFKLTSFSALKVVILGQDPYPDSRLATGLCFDIQNYDGYIPPSLSNIFVELSLDLQKKINDYSSVRLSRWAKQGVLLLNSALTVREGEPMSHEGHGWEEFVEHLFVYLSLKKEKVVYVLWGKKAWIYQRWLTGLKQKIIESYHPVTLRYFVNSPLSFRNSRPFTRTNSYLQDNGLEEIRWIDAEV